MMVRNPKSARLRVLVADDSPQIAQRLTALLGELDGIEPLGPASSGREAIRIVREEAPDGILLDVQMPDGDALEVMQYVETCPDRPFVIVLTNHEGPEYRRRLMAAGADHFFRKSTEFEQAIAMVRRYRGEAADTES